MAAPTPAPAPEGLPRRAAVAALVATAAFVLAGVGTTAGEHPVRALVGAVVALVAAAALFVGRAPLLAGAAATTAGVAVIGTGTGSCIAWFAVCLVAAWCALVGQRWLGPAYWALALALFAGQWVFAQHDPGWLAWSAGTSFAALAALVVRHERRLVGELRTAQAGLVDSARAEERTRIARELHDVIAHSLTVSLLHVTSARVALEHAPAEAAAALAEAERVGRESLGEVRATVGLLRDDDAPVDPRPQPGALDLVRLVEGFRQAGAVVALEVDADLTVVGAAVGLVGYRIVQEALTNAAKHAPGAPASVRVSSSAAQLSLHVESAGRPGTGSGAGLSGMHERAAALGGACSAGPGGAGWVVHACLPLAA